ncbi:MAG: hypothetical protein U0936_12745 [Planctomycetaceae bacterium]
MTNLNSRQRKMSYFIGIILLLGPIVYLGFPAEQNAAESSSGGLGKLAQMRQQYDLGEATLGKVDPSSSAMNLVLLGLRGPAASVLHLKAIEYQEKKQWAKLKTTVDSIILLQPHYVQIWKFQGWNLAYNVSREWDKVDDRFYWVKEGIKFLKLGTDRNQTIPILFHNVGEVISSKMGISDEKKFFRVFFKQDPDPKFEVSPGQRGPDPAINEEGKDSYLVAHDWFVKANEKDDNDDLIGVKGMTHVFFRQGPAKSLINYAEMRSKEGAFDEHIAAWEAGYKAWMEDYGREEFLGLDDKVYTLAPSEEELKQQAERNGITQMAQRKLWESNVKMVNFDFWRRYASAEMDPVTLNLHKTFYDAKQLYMQGKGFDRLDAATGMTVPSEAQVKLEETMQRWLEAKQKFPTMFEDGRYIDEAMLIVQYWQAIHQQNARPLPDDYPLKTLWIENVGKQSEVDREFQMETRGRQLN